MICCVDSRTSNQISDLASLFPNIPTYDTIRTIQQLKMDVE